MREVLLGSVPVLCADGWVGDQARHVVFEGDGAEHRWRLQELDPEFPADWSPFAYIALELRASSPQRLSWRVYTREGVRAMRLQLFGQGVWLRVAVPLQYFQGRDSEGYDMASAGNRPRKSFWFSVSGPFGRLDAVEAVAVMMEYPVGQPTLELRLLGLAHEDPGSEILDQLPVVDEFGQWIPADWPGKVKHLEQLQGEWTREDRLLPPGEFGYSRYGGYRHTGAAATGFFRVEQVEGKWWFVDPDGHLFLSTGVNVMRTAMGTPTAGREDYYAALPPAELAPPRQPAYPGPQASFYTWNLVRRFGEDWRRQWAELTIRRMEAWGLNTMYPGGPELLEAQPRKAYIVTLRDWQTGPAYLGLPDVYTDGFARRVEEVAARECAPRRDDPFLLGYFIGNEPPWPGREAEVVDLLLAGPPGAMRREVQAFLRGGDSPARREQFVLRAFERYLDLITAAVRRHDPQHLNLGIRFGRTPTDAILRAARVFDVYSHNRYRSAPDPEEEEKLSQVTGRPILIGEFHFGTPGKGLGAGLVQVRDDRERGFAYRSYVEQAVAMPAVIGVHWFQWMDQPVTGRMDGENYNIGFVDGTDRPHREFLEGVKGAHTRLLGVHSGRVPPASRRAAVS